MMMRSKTRNHSVLSTSLMIRLRKSLECSGRETRAGKSSYRGLDASSLYCHDTETGDGARNGRGITTNRDGPDGVSNDCGQNADQQQDIPHGASERVRMYGHRASQELLLRTHNERYPLVECLAAAAVSPGPPSHHFVELRLRFAQDVEFLAWPFPALPGHAFSSLLLEGRLADVRQAAATRDTPSGEASQGGPARTLPRSHGRDGLLKRAHPRDE